MTSVRSRFSHAGFTLLEVLVAFTLLAMTLTALLRLFGTSLHNTSLSEDYSYAILVAESALNRVITEQPLHEGQYHGEENEKYKWRAEISRIRHDDFSTNEPLALYKIILRVSWQDGEQVRQFQLATLRAGSPYS